MTLAIGRTPWNQLAALPLETAAAYATPADEVTFVGKYLCKKWGPGSTGIDGTLSSNRSDPRTPANAYLISNWLDFSGMRLFSAHFGARITAGGTGESAHSWRVFMVPGAVQAGGALIEPIVTLPGPDNRNLTGNYAASAGGLCGVLNLPTPTLLGPPYPVFKSAILGWECGQFLSSNSSGALGPCRILLVTVANGADPCFGYLTLYARS